MYILDCQEYEGPHEPRVRSQIKSGDMLYLKHLLKQYETEVIYDWPVRQSKLPPLSSFPENCSSVYCFYFKAVKLFLINYTE